jgi:nicotinate phosphoribosyltransferase
VPWVDDANVSLVTDLYELTMAASYHAHGMDEGATFDLSIRRLPAARRFLVACGLEQALEQLERFSFDDASLRYLATLGLFDDSFLDRLRELRFRGEVWAVPEGEVVFPEEPLLRVTGTLVEAQLVETMLLNTVSFQTMVASKAARVAIACAGREFVDFSPRRDHGADAALKGARAAYVGGAVGTSMVLAGREFGIPLSGTMAHAYVMRFDEEIDAYRTFARDFGERSMLLIDTYDTLEGARLVVEVARELAAEGIRIGGVRLDSGDLVTLSRRVRRTLDEGGFPELRIFASGDLDEHEICRLAEEHAPIDAFGVGTQLGTSADAPSLGAVYKLAEAADVPRMKLAMGKHTYPGRKQVARVRTGGVVAHDVIGLDGEDLPGTPLLERVMAGGARLAPSPPLPAVRDRCRAAVAELPARLRRLDGGDLEPFEVRRSPALDALVTRVRAAHGAPPLPPAGAGSAA